VESTVSDEWCPVGYSTGIVRSGFTTNLAITANSRLMRLLNPDADSAPEQFHRIQRAYDQAALQCSHRD
jgi:hypothetical protein